MVKDSLAEDNNLFQRGLSRSSGGSSSQFFRGGRSHGNYQRGGGQNRISKLQRIPTVPELPTPKDPVKTICIHARIKKEHCVLLTEAKVWGL